MSNFRNRSARTSHFSMIPNQNIKRSNFKVEQRHLTTFDAGYLIPIFVDEVLPGDVYSFNHTIFARMSTPLYPLMDNLYMDTFYFFVPNRLLWTNWKKFMGEQRNPSDSISFVIPQQVSPAGGYAVNSLQDYMGLPTTPMLGANTKSHSALFTRAYNLIWNEWFRDQNLQDSITVDTGDGPDASPSTNYVLRRRGKRHDYFTSCLPWPQKGGTGVTIPLAGNAPVVYSHANTTPWKIRAASSGNLANEGNANVQEATTGSEMQLASTATKIQLDPSGNLFADLSAVSGVLINQLRVSIMVQEFLELDARGGTRYTELLQSHFGVRSQDSRLQRPEYLGGGSTPININPIAQTVPDTTPLGWLAGIATAVDSGTGFSASFPEHGIVLGLAAVRADLTYQQGLHRMWTRSTRYDFYDPIFANLGEKAVRNDEIYCDGSANDILTFGYQEAWAEYRYKPSKITGLFKGTSSGAIDNWHVAQEFGSLPPLNDTFIQDNPPLSRVLAVGSGANGQQFICDMLFSINMARSMPVYSVPKISSNL